MNALLDALDKRTPRERWIMLIVLASAAVYVWDMFMLQPAMNNQKRLSRALQQLNDQSQVLQAQINQAEMNAAHFKDHPKFLQIKDLESQARVLGQNIEAQKLSLISPQNMSQVLNKLLKDSKSMQLVSMQNLPAEEIKLGESGSNAYRHRVKLEFDGTYLGALAYLHEMEQIKWQVQWDRVTLEQKEHPQLRIDVEIQTLSNSKLWLGV